MNRLFQLIVRELYAIYFLRFLINIDYYNLMVRLFRLSRET
jgi:hypothetical protein